MKPEIKTIDLHDEEKKAVQLLMQKMGLRKNELKQINNHYGVTSIQLLELMQFSKYQFVYQNEPPAQCMPCKYSGEIDVAKYF